MRVLNTHFNRIEDDLDNYYAENHATLAIGGTEYEAFIKCKLVHGLGFSIVVPDVIYVMDNAVDFTWIQFYSFLANRFTKLTDNDFIGEIYVDIACGHTIRVRIRNEWHIGNLKDDSNLFRCTIQGPHNLRDYSTGTGKLINGIPYLYLYHHTSEKSKKLIANSSSYIGSHWNYQGTKQLESIHYLYFTSLDRINKPADLKMIAMANSGHLYLVLDLTDRIIPITVYRESTKNRTAILKHLIDSTIIQGNHIWMHTQSNGSVYYQLCSPYIYRVGLIPDSSASIVEERIDRQESCISLDYVILGDATIVSGITAPLDEENTDQIFKIEAFANSDTNLLNFWFDQANKDLYSKKQIVSQRFKTPDT